MAPGYSLTGIGLDPMGYAGLGLTGQYSSGFDNYMPSMSAYNPAFTGANAGMGLMGAGMLGMGGMMANPMLGGMMGGYTEYLTKYQDAINQMEINRAKNTGAMHRIYKDMEANALRDSRISYINQQLVTADETEAVERLFEMINTSNFKDFTKEFDRTKELIINKYRDELGKYGDKTNIDEAAGNLIKTLYSQIASAKTGEVRDIVTDIQRYCDGHITNGIMKGLRKGHHEQYADEILCHCFGLPVERKASKDGVNDAMKYVGYAGSAVEGGLIGAAAGATLIGLGKLVTGDKLKPKFFGGNGKSCWGKLGKGGKFTVLTAIGVAIADCIWKAS